MVDTIDSKDDINKAYSLISTSKVRNEMIVGDVKKSIAQNQTPVILTRFKEHAKLLYDTLKNESLILVATGQKIGEGFDFPRLDVLMLAAPVSFEGRLEQYVGRLKTYKRTGFSIWTGDVQSKQMINAIYDSGNYIENFAQDIVFVYGSAAVCYELIRKMQQVGIDVVTKSEVEERFALLMMNWYGMVV